MRVSEQRDAHARREIEFWCDGEREPGSPPPQHRPVRSTASEHACWDPKDGELCPSRAKPEETLVEARRCADVQIAFRTRV